MKKLSMIACCIMMFLSGKAQDAVTDFLNQQKDPDIFTQVNINAKMFQLIADMTDEETVGIIANLTAMKIITAEKENGQYFNQAKHILEKNPVYENLMSIKEEQEDVWMYIREDKGYISELVILVSDEGEFVLINFIGKINLKEISHLAKSVNIDGMEYLDKVKDTPDQKAGKVSRKK